MRGSAPRGSGTFHPEGPDGEPLSVGRKTRSIPSPIKRALLRRDRTCRFPGCTNRPFVDGHHIEHWAHGGETSLRNMVGLCGHHHRYVHEYGYTIELHDHQPVFFDRHHREVKQAPDRPPVPDHAWITLRDQHGDLGIDADTNVCLWDGQPVDYGPVIDALVRIAGLT